MFYIVNRVEDDKALLKRETWLTTVYIKLGLDLKKRSALPVEGVICGVLDLTISKIEISSDHHSHQLALLTPTSAFKSACSVFYDGDLRFA